MYNSINCFYCIVNIFSVYSITHLVIGHHGAHGDLLNVAVFVVEVHQLQHLLPVRAARQQLVVVADLGHNSSGKKSS